jgi:hypothetical protein
MSVKNAFYPANMVCDLKEYLDGCKIVNISIGANKGYYILAVDNVPEKINGTLIKEILLGEDNFICDCYALNVVNDNKVWFCYYCDFLLGKIKGGKIDYYDPKISGADGFLIYDRYALFRGGYNNQNEYHLLHFVKDDKLREERTITFTDEDDKVIVAENYDYRGSRLLLVVGSKLYYIDLVDIIWKD